MDNPESQWEINELIKEFALSGNYRITAGMFVNKSEILNIDETNSILLAMCLEEHPKVVPFIKMFCSKHTEMLIGSQRGFSSGKGVLTLPNKLRCDKCKRGVLVDVAHSFIEYEISEEYLSHVLKIIKKKENE